MKTGADDLASVFIYDIEKESLNYNFSGLKGMIIVCDAVDE